MSGYKPQQREVRARILTPMGWIEGTFHVPQMHDFMHHLDSMHEFEVLTKVHHMSIGQREEFLDLRRDAIQLLLLSEDEAVQVLAKPSSKLVEHQVTCLLATGYVRGRLDILENVRVSDFFRTKRGFVPICDARVQRHGETVDESTAAATLILVNTAAIIGVSEPSVPKG